MKYERYTDVGDDWIYPKHSGFKLMCCECNLVHLIRFGVVEKGGKKHVRFKIDRDERATSAARRKKCRI